ncbi:hypothetical protein [Scleromatobacter humisilvae]|nr:hypothetical protein [Scleromatobacter humisilvae]
MRCVIELAAACAVDGSSKAACAPGRMRSRGAALLKVQHVR